MTYDNDQIIQELEETFKQFQRQQKTRRRGRRGQIEVYCEIETDDDTVIARREEAEFQTKQLADISREFLKMKRVFRWHLKKIADFGDADIISVCHRYVEQNRLKDEWEEFRGEREKI